MDNETDKKTPIKLLPEPPQHIMYCYSEINPDILRLKGEGAEIFHGISTKE